MVTVPPGRTLAIMDPVRAAIATAIRSRVAGPGARTVVRDIVEADGERWFDRDRPIRVVHADAAMFVGGLRALLLQSLHPLAMAGVAAHSDFRTDPWGRLQRTAEFLTWTTFGTAEQAERACRRVRGVHALVNGTAPDGRPYSATDPHLLLWVHLAEIDSFLAAHQRYGTPKLDAAGRDGYVADMARVAEAVGVIDPPRSEAELRAALDSVPSRVARHQGSPRRRPFPVVAAAPRRRVRAVRATGGVGGVAAAVVGPRPAPAAGPAGGRAGRGPAGGLGVDGTHPLGAGAERAAVQRVRRPATRQLRPA